MRTSFEIWDLLSGFILVLTAGLLVFYGVIFLNPYVPFNPFPPEALPESIVIPTSTPTFAQLPPTATLDPELFASPTLRPSSTSTATITPTVPTATASLTPTITGTPPTMTPSPTLTRTPTYTLNPAVLTRVAATAAVKTSQAIATKTYQAKTDVYIKQTQAVQKTQTAAAILSQQQTQTQSVINQDATATSQSITQTAIPTQTQAALETAVAATATQTMVTAQAEMTQTAQVTVVYNQSIAYSVDTDGDNYYEQIVTDRFDKTNGFPWVLNIGAIKTAARAVTDWWADGPEDYLLFSEPTGVNQLLRILYDTVGTIESVPISTGWAADPVISAQVGANSSRWIVYTYAVGGAGTDRNLWKVRADGTLNQQISNNNTWDDHDVRWTSDGKIVFVTGESSAAENVYLMDPLQPGSYPGMQLSFYTVTTTEISSPKWCKGYDWASETWYEKVIFAMRTSASDDWDLYVGYPSQLISQGNNDSLIQLTNTNGVNELAPDWSKYCSRVSYLSNEGGNYDIWTMNADGSDHQQLSNSPEKESGPVYHP
ncbi:MAG: hypothetical protein JW750_13005 [Anaerolineaceae bacterium]|nr:hypothetical protein [Anaerolineaceae bacterium]